MTLDPNAVPTILARAHARLTAEGDVTCDPNAVPGSFSEKEGLSLGACAVDGPEGPILELGAYLGRSLCFMAHALMEAGKAPTIYAVDTWRLPGSNAGWSGSAKNLAAFKVNVARLSYPGEIIRLEVDANELMRIWRIPVALVHLDYDHVYAGTRSGLEGFAPWVMPGGYIGAHGYDRVNFPDVVVACDEWAAKTPGWEGVIEVDQSWGIRRDQ